MRFNDRTGESRIMNNGLEATIMAYHNSSNVDVQFENGARINNRTYKDFQDGSIKCPMLIKVIGDYAEVTNANIPINQKFIMDVEDLPLLKEYSWSENATGYIRSSAYGKGKFLHRLIMGATDKIQVDHINGDKSDNRKRNLRICTNAENNWNKEKWSNGSSVYKGVHFRTERLKWCARIHVNGKTISLGVFDDEKEAARVYNEAALKYYGEFAKLNTI